MEAFDYYVIVMALPAVGLAISYLFTRVNASLRTSVEEATRPAVSAALRAELDQTQGWWDEQFHKALTGVEQPVLYGDPEYYEERSITGVQAIHMVYQASALPSCTCGSCTTTRRSCD